MGRTHEIVSLSWKKPNTGLRLDLAFSELDNALNVTLWLEALKSPTLSGGFGVKKLEKKSTSRKLLDDFFKHLEKLPQDPRPRISRMEVIRKALENLR